MEVDIPDKSYFRIGEVSKILGVEPYVVRYWEAEFKSVKPMRTRSDQRLYRKKDLEELLVIRNLLYRERFTIEGAKKRLSEMRKEDVPPHGEAQGKDSTKRLRKIKEGLKEIRNIVT